MSRIARWLEDHPAIDCVIASGVVLLAERVLGGRHPVKQAKDTERYADMVSALTARREAIHA